MKKIVIVSAFLFFVIATVSAQKDLLGVSWGINFPTNNDYLNKTSFAGGRIEYRHFLRHNENVTLGLSLDWSSYEQHIPRQTFQKPDGNSAVTSDFVATAYQVPFTATAHYYFK